MKITKGEYCQFSLRGRMKFLNEFGKLMAMRVTAQRIVKLYKLYDFYVEVFYNRVDSKIEHIEPVKNRSMHVLFGE